MVLLSLMLWLDARSADRVLPSITGLVGADEDVVFWHTCDNPLADWMVQAPKPLQGELMNNES